MQMAQAKKSITKRRAPEYRALTVYESLTDDLRTFAVADNSAAPHLRRGEFAVIDTADCQPQNGELYVIQWASGDRKRRIVQVRSDYLNLTGPGAEKSLCWWVADLVRPRSLKELDVVIDAARKAGRTLVLTGLSDGPYQTDHLSEKLLGRVVGVAFAPLGGLLAPAAGWENEEAGNAAFDLVEYVDVLLAVGYKPLAHIDDDGRATGLCLCLPQMPATDEEEAEYHRVADKYGKASAAGGMVARECIRRRLTYGGTPR